MTTTGPFNPETIEDSARVWVARLIRSVERCETTNHTSPAWATMAPRDLLVSPAWQALEVVLYRVLSRESETVSSASALESRMEGDVEAEPLAQRRGLIRTSAARQALVDLLEPDDPCPRSGQHPRSTIDIDHSIQTLTVVKVVCRHRQLVLHTHIVIDEAANLRDIRQRRNAPVARWVR